MYGNGFTWSDHAFLVYLVGTAFASAVDWSETWIQALLVSEVALFIIVLLTRKMFYTQCFVFFMICILVFTSEALNTQLAARWQEFATQNSFDEHGVFIATLYEIGRASCGESVCQSV